VINPESPLSQVLIMYRPGPQKTSYIYGKGLVSQEKDGHTLYYHYDMRGSTVAITNQNGDIVDRFSYLPFGGVIAHTFGSTETPFLYNGRDGVMNDGNGLYYMRARFYSPEIRRFVNRDVLLGEVMVSNALNRFAYVNGNPVSLVDPLGLSGIGLWDKFKEDFDLRKGFSQVGDIIGVLGSGGEVVGGAIIGGAEDIFGLKTNIGNQLVKHGVNGVGSSFESLANHMGMPASGALTSSITSGFADTFYKGNVDERIIIASDTYRSLKDIKGLYQSVNKYTNLVLKEKRALRFSMDGHRSVKAQANYTKLHLKRRNSRRSNNKLFEEILMDGFDVISGAPGLRCEK